MEKKKPEIRFNGFEEEWVRHSLNYYLTVSSEKNQEGQYSKYDIYSVSREYGVINQIEYQGKSFAGASLLNYGVVQTEDIVYTKSPLKSQPYGIIKVNSGKSGLVSALYGVFHPQESVCSYFVQVYFDLDYRLNSYLRPLVNKGAKNTLLISDADVLQGEVIFPSIDEQEKLVSFFTTLDKLIVKLEAKLDKLRKLKQALLEKMFTNINRGNEIPEIRFKGYTDKWQVKELREVAKLRRGLTYSPGDICNDRKGIRVLRSSNISEDIFLLSEDDVFVKQSAVNIPYIHNYDILITAANGSSRLVGKHCIVADIQSDSCVPGGFMLCASTDSPFFLQASMSSSWYQTFIATYTLGGNGTIGNLSKTALEKQRFQLPSFSEQEQIGKCFTQIDTHFSKTSTKLTKLRNIKQSLLQKMFA